MKFWKQGWLVSVWFGSAIGLEFTRSSEVQTPFSKAWYFLMGLLGLSLFIEYLWRLGADKWLPRQD